MATGLEMFARARVLATQTGGTDANMSAVIDGLGGLRAALNHAIRAVYRAKSSDQKFLQDIAVSNTVVIGTGTGTCPDAIMREFLHLANITDDNDSLVSYKSYQLDTQQNLQQLGYLYLVGDTFNYIAPAPDLDQYSGNVIIYVPSFPVLPASMEDEIPMPSEATTDDVILQLSQMLSAS